MAMDLLIDSDTAFSLFSRLLALYTRAPATLHTLTLSSARLLKVSTPSLVSDQRVIRHPLSLTSEVVRKSGTGVLWGETAVHRAQVSSWVEVAHTLDRREFVHYLDDALLSRTFLVSNHVTVADIAAYAAVFSLLKRELRDEEKRKLINVVRWVRHLQSLPGFVEAAGSSIEFSPAVFALDKAAEEEKKDGDHSEPKKPKKADKGAEEHKKPADAKTEQPEKKTEEGKTAPSEETKKPSGEKQKKAAGEEHKKPAKEPKKPTEEKKAQPKGGKKGGAASDAPAADPATLLDMRVGRILKIWRHPTREHIFCENVDMGNGEVRTIASGLVGHVTEEQMTNSLVVILGNLKPRKMDDFMSQGMVLCTTLGEVIEPLQPPAASQPGDRIIVEGLPSEPLPELPPKKQYWESAMKELRVDSEGRATYKSQPLVTPHGPITSPTLKAGTIS